MYKIVVLIMLLSSCYFYDDLHHTYGSINIDDYDGVPCFSIDKDEIKSLGIVHISSMEVYNRSHGQQNKPLWETSINNVDANSGTGDDCYLYGNYYPEANLLAKDLEVGKVYSVQATARNKNLVAIRPGYLGFFCITKDASGKRRVHAVTATDQWHVEHCDLLPGSSI